jgi:hypothetical protein
MTRSRTGLAGLLVLAGLVGGCSGDPQARPLPPAASRTTPTSPPDVPSAVSAAFGDVVDDPGAQLTSAYVERHGSTLSVNAYWICSHIRCGNQQVIASSADGFATADYVHLTRRTYAERMLPPRPPKVPQLRELRHLITSPVTSLRRGLLAVVAGGDGATLLPFERVVRSTDWSSYHPLRARFEPPLLAAPRGFSSLVTFEASARPDPVIWATTWDSRLYVSTDDAASFSEVPAR